MSLIRPIYKVVDESAKLFQLESEMFKNNKCEECGEFIQDLYYFVIASKFYWHIDCLKCNFCGCNLKSKCFMINRKCYCTEDYSR